MYFGKQKKDKEEKKMKKKKRKQKEIKGDNWTVCFEK